MLRFYSLIIKIKDMSFDKEVLDILEEPKALSEHLQQLFKGLSISTCGEQK
jgi:hypothetical protein